MPNFIHNYMTRLQQGVTLFVVLALLGFTHAVQAAIPAQERAALIDLYNSTNGAGWKNNSGWLGAVGTECGWIGVNCSNDHVIGIHLYENQLTGTIPANLEMVCFGCA